MGTKLVAKIRWPDGRKYEYSIKDSAPDVPFDDFMDGLIIPLIHAMGYSPKLIKEYFDQD